MKMVFLISILLSANAFASKARVNSLIGADHIVDSQTTFLNPAHIHLLSNYLTFEFGAAGAGAEAGFLRNTDGGGKVMGYIGHQNPTPLNTDIRTSNTYIAQNNPVEVLYGTGDQAYGVSLSNVDNKKSGTKETTIVGKWGIVRDDFSAYAHVHLISNAEKTAAGVTDKATGGPQFLVGGNKKNGDMHYYGAVHIGNGKIEPGGGAASSDVKDTNIVLGLEDRSLKTTSADIYYGIGLNLLNRDQGGRKYNLMALPVFLGLEYAVNTWATFRASASQNLLLGSVKDEISTPTNSDADGIGANTRVAAGLGLKYNSLLLDGSLAAQNSGAINGSAFLTQASVTYFF